GGACACLALGPLGALRARGPVLTDWALGTSPPGEALRTSGTALTCRTRLTLRSGHAVSACWASFTLQTLEALRATRTSGTFSSVGTISTSRTPRALFSHEGVEPFGFRADEPCSDCHLVRGRTIIAVSTRGAWRPVFTCRAARPFSPI